MTVAPARAVPAPIEAARVAPRVETLVVPPATPVEPSPAEAAVEPQPAAPLELEPAPLPPPPESVEPAPLAIALPVAEPEVLAVVLVEAEPEASAPSVPAPEVLVPLAPLDRLADSGLAEARVARAPLARAPRLLTLETFVPPPAPAPQEVDWFQSGPYIGGLIGLATLGASGGEFEDDLAQLGSAASADLDEADFAWRAFGGWRFDAPFSLELGYTHLGRAESTVAVNTPNVQAFLEDVVATQPFLGRGVELEGRWWVVDTDRFDVGLGGGLWYWTAEIEAMAATGERASATETGLDPLLGIDVLVRLLGRLDARAGLEHYWIEDEGATVLWVGLQGRVF